MTRRYLLDNHPVKQKFDKLTEVAEDLGLLIYFNSYKVTVKDKETGCEFYLEDIEDASDKHRATITCFPYSMEYKLIVKE